MSTLPVYGILGEGDSDVETLKALVRSIANNHRLRVETFGCEGCGKMLKDGHRQLKLFKAQGCTRFIVCHDADGPDPAPTHQKLTQMVGRSGVGDCCIVVPVQEIEAWILADPSAINRVVTGWKPKPVPNPESVANPKEYLRRESVSRNGKARYIPALHNAAVAKHLAVEIIEGKCKSFVPLAHFVKRPKQARQAKPSRRHNKK